jgi:hypothetical protein
MKTVRLLLLIIATLLLAGCGTRHALYGEYPYYQVTPGASSVLLHQPIRLRSGDARVFIQGGEVLKLRWINQYAPSCNFEVRSLGDEPREILPGRFTITRVDSGEEQVVSLGGVRLAALHVAGLFRHDGSATVSRYFHFWLDSAEQPDVMRLTCRGVLADQHEAELPLMSEIAEALGEIASIETGK